jgi:malate dehydrogenase
MKSRVTVIGAGQVGATTAQRLIEKGVSDVILFDIVEGLAEGKALDLMQAASLEGHSQIVKGTTRYEDMKGSDIVIITAGLPRKPGMTREDLLQANAKIITSITQNLKKHTPNAIIITVTNPLDIMTQLAYKLLGFPKERVFGMAGVLDSARMRYFISQKVSCQPHEVSAMVLGGHGDLMVPVMSQIKVKGKTLESLSNQETQEIIKRTQAGGAEIVSLLKMGSAFYAPGSSVAEMVISILQDKDAILPVCAYCTGQYGIQETFCGVPVKLCRKGLKEIVEIPLTEEESQSLKRSAQKVKQGVEEVEQLLKG